MKKQMKSEENILKTDFNNQNQFSNYLIMRKSEIFSIDCLYKMIMQCLLKKCHCCYLKEIFHVKTFFTSRKFEKKCIMSCIYFDF